MRDLIIIGAGPAGLAASLYATNKRLDYLVISKDLGGKSNYSITVPDEESMQAIRASELVMIYKSRLEYLRHSYRIATVASLTQKAGAFEIKLDDGTSEQAHTAIVATGTKLRRLDVPGELKFLSRGLGYSSISYSHLFAGKAVFIAGDTDRVVNAAVELSLHAHEVSLALLPGATVDPGLLAYADSIDRVTVLRDATINEFTGDEFARSVTLTTREGTKTIVADGFFVEPEPTPNSTFVGDDVSRTPDGYLSVDGANMTSVPGLFAAGDVTGNGYEQILVSLGEGAKAVLSAYRYLLSNRLLTTE